jgi:hypothetical protein
MRALGMDRQRGSRRSRRSASPHAPSGVSDGWPLGTPSSLLPRIANAVPTRKTTLARLSVGVLHWFVLVPAVSGRGVAPFMGPKARKFLKRRSQSWMDLSGNADIRGLGLCIVVQGKPNTYAAPGRPSTAFSPKASRLSRAMLMEPEKWWRQTELVDATGLSAGYVSKVVGRLEDDGLVERGDNGHIRPKDPSLLLDAWSQIYDFSRHEISRYHALGNTGAAVLSRLAASLDERGDLNWAATGLAASWQIDRFADFRLVTIYVSKPLLDPEHLSLRSVERGENVWVVVPRDEGVLHGSQEFKGVRCAHPVQVYLDLLGHPERANEAASHLRSSHLGWRS